MENNKLINRVKNASAEKVLGTLAKVILWIGIIISGLLLLAGFVMTFIVSALSDELTVWSGLLAMVLAVLNLIPFLLMWASIKIWVNISRNIFVIKEVLMSNHDNLGKR